MEAHLKIGDSGGRLLEVTFIRNIREHKKTRQETHSVLLPMLCVLIYGYSIMFIPGESKKIYMFDENRS